MKYIIIGLLAYMGYVVSTDDHPAIAFVNSLDTDQRSKVVHQVDDVKRTDWHYLPAGSYQRPGLKLSELFEGQKLLLHDLLKSVLSEKGYNKTLAIIDLENILAELENNYVHRDPDQYAIAIFGDPSSSDPWSWSFSGHHISLHFTYVDGKLSSTPRFLGANPGEVKAGPKKGLRVLAAEEDLGFELLHSLTSEQLVKASISKEARYEIITTNQAKVEPLTHQGISENEMTTEQKEILSQLISEYLSTLPKTLANQRMKTVEVEEVSFAWIGASEKGKAHYYSIQGTTFLIEFDNAQNNANHVHTVWRDFDGDFGRDLIREHRKEHKH